MGYPVRFTPNLISAAVITSLSLISIQLPAAEKKDEQEKIIITGSRIKRSDIEGASTVVSLTSEEMQQQGFSTLYDALRSLTSSTGSVVGEQNSASFTPNAQALNLRGLGPGRTLVLLNGRRIADYASPYNGRSNFVNLAQIPLAIVHRVEILSGGASAIYGSDAMAGVVNIITKSDYQGQSVSVRVGETEEGGGESTRFQWSGGVESSNFSNLWAFEYYDASPIRGSDRKQLELRYNPGLQFYDYYDLDGDNQYYDLPSSTICDNLNYSYFADANGNVCFSQDAANMTLRNDRKRTNFYDKITFQQGDYNELFLEFHLWKIDSKSTSSNYFWESPTAVLLGNYDNSNNFVIENGVYLFRSFSSDEVGDNSINYSEQGADVHLGLKGLIAEAFDFEFVVSHSFQDNEEKIRLMKEEAVNAFFLGQYDEAATQAYGVPTYTDYDLNNFFNPMTSAQWQQLTGVDDTQLSSETTSVTFTMNGEFMEFGDDYAQFAMITEWSRQSYDIDLHQRRLNSEGQGWWGYTGTEGTGERDRYALGLETRWPISDTFTLSVAGRYDKYDDITDVDDALTYNLGFEWRPADGLLIRAMNTSNFRAPDMHYVYAEKSGFYISNVFDPMTNTVGQLEGVTQGSAELEEERGLSQSLGVVYEPVQGLSFSADFYRIEIKDMVEYEGINEILTEEFNLCDSAPNASTCTDYQAFHGIVRNVNLGNALTNITLRPINTSLTEQIGLDTSFKYALITDESGIWRFSANHTNILKSRRQETESQDVDNDWRNNRANDSLRSRFRATASWEGEEWRVSLLSNRIGTLASFDGSERLDSWTVYNLSTAYQVTQGLSLELHINNLTEEYPRAEANSNTWPYFNTTHYNAAGREFLVEARYEF